MLVFVSFLWPLFPRAGGTGVGDYESLASVGCIVEIDLSERMLGKAEGRRSILEGVSNLLH